MRRFRESIAAHADLFADCPSVLDIGCGTGALVHVLAKRGHTVTGIDGSAGMLAVARRLNRGVPAAFRHQNALKPDGTGEQYDLVTASFVLHGLPGPQRQALYGAMQQLARRRVIIMDYSRNRSLLTSLIEWLEGGDYFRFIAVAEAEMRQAFPRVIVVPVSRMSAWYVCECAGEPAEPGF
ncbi:Ubiquinone biosynthesis O-methyltransferase [bioreactor metagenome]|uniref:Ubiquinone biosynthesis O-methyltransferase n=1 Tax=bioreactor metagenome TaxID=1076179 RepID=A0A645HQ83_9ZZZZ